MALDPSLTEGACAPHGSMFRASAPRHGTLDNGGDEEYRSNMSRKTKTPRKLAVPPLPWPGDLEDAELIRQIARLARIGHSDDASGLDAPRMRREYAAELWHRGWTVRAIGKATGVSGARIHQLVVEGRELLDAEVQDA